MELEKMPRMALLLDIYGGLLTERQRDFMQLYYEHDLSLGEIGENFGISRQAVRDILLRAEKTILKFEDKLDLLQKHDAWNKLVIVDKLLAECINKGNKSPLIAQAQDLIKEVLRDGI